MTDKLSSSPHPIRDAAEANPSRRRFVRHMGLAAAALGTLPLVRGVEIKKEIEAR